MIDGIIFDIDGTLADTNGHHVTTWERSFERHGFRVFPDRIAVEIGKGGDKLVPSILGEEAEKKYGEKLREAQGEEFVALARSETFKLFPGAVELMEEVRRRGLKSALATSGARKNLEAIERSTGVRLTELVDEVITADDVKESKPSPDLVVAAFEKLGLSPAQCMMFGDTIYDAEACRGAGVVLLGLLSGYNSRSDLIAAGARAVWRDIAHVRVNFDEALRIASPGPACLTYGLMESLMSEAISTARQGLADGEAPIGCVVARGDGEIVSRGYNEMQKSGNKVAHAEIVTLTKAAASVPIDARDLILVSTLEPCVMCTGAAMQGAVDVIVYGLKAPADSGTGRIRSPESSESQMPRIVGGILADECRELFKEWMASNNNGEQSPYIRQLLALTEDG